MLQPVIRTLITLATLSLITGLIMAAFGLQPGQVFVALGEAIGDGLRWARGAVAWAWPYVLLGAGVVVPVWAVLFLVRRVRRR